MGGSKCVPTAVWKPSKIWQDRTGSVNSVLLTSAVAKKMTKQCLLTSGLDFVAYGINLFHMCFL